MRLNDVLLTNENHFVAMEYYGLILNRTYLVIILDGHLLGLVCNGLVASDVDDGPGAYRGMRKLTKTVVSPLVVSSDLNLSSSYINKDLLKEYSDVNIFDDFKTVNKANFKYSLSNEMSVLHDSSKKWGIGNYPHDGKIYIKANNKCRELIVLGDQCGKSIVKTIQKTAYKCQQ